MYRWIAFALWAMPLNGATVGRRIAVPLPGESQVARLRP